MSLSAGRAAVTTPGVPVQLSTAPNFSADTIAITAFTDNSEAVVIGDRGVVADLSARIGHPLLPGKTVVLGDERSPVQPGHVWVDALVPGEGVTWVAV